jgi:mono/diheme cytochrome c family protein
MTFGKSLAVALALVGAGTALVAAGSAPQIAGSAAARTPTFSKDVAPIVFAKCAACHRPGEVAPMSLLSFKDVRPWAGAIKEKVASRVMPPWHADRAYGTFRNNPSLSQDEIDTIVAWVNGGAPEGNPKDAPAVPTFTEGWQIGKPDQVFEMARDFEVPARGTIDYQYFEVPTNFSEDRWMQAGEVRAGDKAHVHHIIVYVREPQARPRANVVSIRPIFAAGERPSLPSARTTTAGGAGGTANNSARTTDNMLVNWAVGEDAPVFLPGQAKRIAAGSTLIFQVHYTTNGTPGRDRSRLGLIFSKAPPTQEVRTSAIANPLFAIPGGAADHQVEAEATFNDDVKVWTMHPHMHLRGKDMTYTAVYPDGRKEIVLRVPKFDFGWQTDYWLSQPLSLPKGSKLHVVAHFDNSPANKANPDPTATVRWGDQTWEEMMIGFFTYTVEKAGGPEGPQVRPQARVLTDRPASSR